MRVPTVGDLRRRLAIEQANDAPDGAGGAVRTWTTVAQVWGRIEPRRRRESVESGRLVGEVTHRIVIRRREGIDGRVRFVSGDTVFRVLAVEDLDPARRFLRCLCVEEQP